MSRFPCSYLKGEVELTEERERHIRERHPDLLPEYRRQLIETLAARDRVRRSRRFRIVSVPLAWSQRLSEATPAQKDHFEIIEDGYGVHWPDVDEDLSVEGMLHGVPARRSKKWSLPEGHRRQSGGAVLPDATF